MSEIMSFQQRDNSFRVVTERLVKTAYKKKLQSIKKSKKEKKLVSSSININQNTTEMVKLSSATSKRTEGLENQNKENTITM